MDRMDRSDAAREVKSRYKEYLRPAKKKNTYICPLCGNGTGKDGDGLSIDKHSDGTHLKCFKCGFYGDIVDLYQQENNCSIGEAFTALYDRFGIIIDNKRMEHKGHTEHKEHIIHTGQTERTEYPIEAHKEDNMENIPTTEKSPAESPTEATENKPDFTGYYKNCKEHITDDIAKDYLSFRGLSEETADRYFLGYDSDGDNQGFMIIPCAKSFYVARNTDRQNKFRYKNPTGVSIELFNLKALYNESGRPVFITEGAIDALSVIEAGGEAVALNSTSNARKLLDKLEKRKTDNVIILCLDKDDSGKKASANLAEGFKRLRIPFISADITRQYKDPNEALTNNREMFFKAVASAVMSAKEIKFPGLLTKERIIEALEAVDDHYLNLPRFPELTKTLKIRTHDTIVIAADTGAGKSSLSINFLYDLQKEYPALYINLEMDKATVLQRLISIQTIEDLDKIEGYKHDEKIRPLVNDAIEKITARKEIQLLEDVYDIKDIEAQIKNATKRRKEPTIVFIDTGLLVTTKDRAASRYERFTQISEELRRISRLNNVVMFVLLQQNRSGKAEENKQPTNSSLKESGSWENDATKIMFLWKNTKTDKKEIVITKNRNGKTGTIPLAYVPKCQIYSEEKGTTIKNEKKIIPRL